MKTINVNGDIICTDMKWIYNWLEYESCCPADVKNVIAELTDEKEELRVIINSPGGDVQAGQEIYSILKDIQNPVTINVQSMAASAASMIAMAGDTVRMSPVSLLVITAICSIQQTYCKQSIRQSCRRTLQKPVRRKMNYEK